MSASLSNSAPSKHYFICVFGIVCTTYVINPKLPFQRLQVVAFMCISHPVHYCCTAFDTSTVYDRAIQFGMFASALPVQCRLCTRHRYMFMHVPQTIIWSFLNSHWQILSPLRILAYIISSIHDDMFKARVYAFSPSAMLLHTINHLFEVPECKDPEKHAKLNLHFNTLS